MTNTEDLRIDSLAAAIAENTAAQGVDLWAVDTLGLSATKWADMTDRDPTTVARNVRRARD